MKGMLLVLPLIDDGDLGPGVEERQLAQAVGEHVIRELVLAEDLRIRLEGDARAVLFGLARGFDVVLRLAALVALRPDLAVPVDLDLDRLRQSVDDRDSHPMQSAGDLVGAVVELASRMQHGHHHLEGRLAAQVAGQLGVGHRVDRDARAVVEDSDGISFMQDDVHGAAPAGQDLVDRVVHGLIDQVMQAGRAGGSYVHGRTFTHRIQSFQNLDL